MPQSDAYMEFLNENANRAFPFVEGRDLSDDSEAYILDDGIVLDARGFSRQYPGTRPQLRAILGPNTSPIGDYFPMPGNWSLIFVSGTNQSFRYDIPVSQAEWPATLNVGIPDPDMPQDMGILQGILRVTIGDALSKFPLDKGYLFTDKAILEPSVFLSLFRVVLDPIKLVHRSGSDDYVAGDVILSGGYNFSIQMSSIGLTLFPSLYAGKYGEFLGNLTPPEQNPCTGALFTIDGLQPNERGEFFFYGGNFIKVINIPTQHKIQIVIDNIEGAKIICP